VLAYFAGPAMAVSAITAVIGVFLLYKGLGVDDYLTDLAVRVRESLYSGRVSIVTYVVAVGLSLVGVFVGALGVSGLGNEGDVIIPAMQFAYDSVPWLAMAALAASTGRLLDVAIQEDSVRSSYLNIPFGVVAVGLVVRGFSASFPERAGVVPAFDVPALRLGVVSVAPFSLSAGERLAVFVVAGVLVSLVGVRIATYLGGTSIDEEELPRGGP